MILIPPGLSEKSEIAKNKASEGYKKAWGMYTATLIGNVTPENADFVLDSFSGMVTGEIRSIVTEQIAQELDTLKQEKVSSTFEIVRVTYEPESDKVFVTGRNRMTGAGGKSSPTEQTFEVQDRREAILSDHHANGFLCRYAKTGKRFGKRGSQAKGGRRTSKTD